MQRTLQKKNKFFPEVQKKQLKEGILAQKKIKNESYFVKLF